MPEKRKPLEREFEYFRTHQSEFSEKHANQFVVIVGEKTIGFFNTIAEAITNARKTYLPGTFFVELCSSDPAYYHVTLVNWNVS
jgi:hypothetical protein